MLASLGAFFTRLVRKYLPDAFVFAIGLTVLTFILGIIINNQTPMQMIEHWGGGLWNLLTFSMQVSLTLVTGFILAHTVPVQKVLKSAFVKNKKSSSGGKTNELYCGGYPV